MTEKYVAVVFFGGPRDGDRVLFSFPPSLEWHFTPEVAKPEGSLDVIDPNRVVHRYVMNESQDGFDVITFDDVELQDLLKEPGMITLRARMHEKRALRYDWEGTV